MRFIVADDHELVREGLALSLKTNHPDAVVVEVEDGDSLMKELAHDAVVSLILLDLRMPNTQPFELLATISHQWPAIKLVVLSASENQRDVDMAFDHGARGFIPKSTSTKILLTAIDQILLGKVYVPDLPEETPASIDFDSSDQRVKKLSLPSSLTKRQIDVLALLVKGKTNRGIANNLSLSECTIKIHVANIFKSLDVSNRTEAVVKANLYYIPRG